MTTKWTTNTLSGNNAASGGEASLAEQFVVLLLYGKNSFGDKIYSYLKITLGDLQNLKSAIRSGNSFNPSDFGSVIAAGRGEPTPEIRKEVAGSYQVIDSQAPSAPPVAAPSEKKAWDEY